MCTPSSMSRALDEWNSDFWPACKKLREYIEARPCNKVFDLIQFVLRHRQCPPEFVREMQHTFSECRLAYRIDLARPPTILTAATPEEGDAVADALRTLRGAGLRGSAAHLRKASEHVNAGDWAGSVRESIHAVESVARQLDPDAAKTLEPALAALEKCGALHPALKGAFSKLVWLHLGRTGRPPCVARPARCQRGPGRGGVHAGCLRILRQLPLAQARGGSVPVTGQTPHRGRLPPGTGLPRLRPREKRPPRTHLDAAHLAGAAPAGGVSGGADRHADCPTPAMRASGRRSTGGWRATVVETVEDERVGGRTVARRKRKTQGGILHWKRESENEPDLDWFRARIREAYEGRAPRVLDPFAGGGAIPLEAMRLGCEVTAVDLNPVAWFILKCTLEYPRGLAGETRPLPAFALRDRDFMTAFLKAKGVKGRALTRELTALGLGDDGETAEPKLLDARPVPEADLAWQVRAWARRVLAAGRCRLARRYPTYAAFQAPEAGRPAVRAAAAGAAGPGRGRQRRRRSPERGVRCGST